MIKFIAMHHSGGLASDKYAKSQHLTWQHIDSAHKERWNFKSSLGFFGGYNFFVELDGNVKQFRAIGEETAAQLGHNFDTISICVAGNFVQKNGVPVELPTEAQKKAVCDLLNSLLQEAQPFHTVPGTIINISKDSIHHHSFYSSTECDCLPDAYWRDQLTEYLKPAIVPVPATEPSPEAVSASLDIVIAFLKWLKEHLKVIFSEKRLGVGDRAHCGDL